MGAYNNNATQDFVKHDVKCSKHLVSIAPYSIIFLSGENFIIEIAIPIMTATNKMAIKSPVVKAAKIFLGTICRKTSEKWALPVFRQ